MDDKLKKLFESARTDPSPIPSNTFASRVVSAISASPEPAPEYFFDAVAGMARRLVVPAMALVMICAAAEFYFSPGSYSTQADTAQLTEEWLFTLN